MEKTALIVWGGWEGHTPKECAELVGEALTADGFRVELSNTLDSYLDEAKMNSVSVVVPLWTMGQITPEQEKGLLAAVAGGAGCAGFHGGMCDAFRNNTEYQWMTGAQWVAHPGGLIPSYEVNIVERDHEIMKGLDDFTLTNTEQYYLHVDPSNHVLATTTFDCPDAPTGHGTVMPAVYTRQWGKGRVFYASFGHTYKDFEVPEALEIVRRGIAWASR